jgi:crotonobetainyl-CoA:carnitine CoA-transferase CaiB-like acyl-CoA transferase
MAASQPTGPLSGVRVVELSSIVMAPYATQLLGDLGADVVKLEPLEGDPGRRVGTRPHPELSGVALNLLRNKRSVAVDLKHPEGREIAHRLVERSAAFVTNFRPRTLSALAMTWEDLSSRRPDLVYCEAHGAGAELPVADLPAYDDVVQAASGLVGVTARTGATPSFVPTILVDKVCGVMIALAVTAALAHRATTGVGQRVEVPMIDAAIAFTLVEHLDAATPVPAAGPPGYPRVLSPHRRPYPTSDGWVAILPYLADDWRRLWSGLGDDAMVAQLSGLEDPAVMSRAVEMYERLGRVTPERSTGQWLTFCHAFGIAAAAVASLDEIVERIAPELGVLTEAWHPTVGPYRHVNSPMRFSVTPTSLHRPAPLLGEHTTEVLTELGWDPARIAQLADDGVIRQADPPEV